MKKTALNAVHKELGGRMVEFGGWEMPVQYKGILEEHKAVRERVGIFDTTHMGEFVVKGPDTLALLQYGTTNDVAALALGQAQYSYFCNPEGGVEDDCLVYHFADHHYVVVNASPQDSDFARLQHLAADKHFNVELTNESDETGKLDIQGPLAVALIQRFTDTDLSQLKYYHATLGTVAAVPCRISRTGYTGEDGVELFFPLAENEKLWRLFVEHGAEPCGLGARDVLRLEASLPLSGSDVAPPANRNPICAGFTRFVHLEKDSDFVGRAALRAFAAPNGCGERMINFEMTGRAAPARHGYAIVTPAGEHVGEVTSGSFSPSLNKNIGMGWVRGDLAAPEAALAVLVRDQPVGIRAIKRPMYKRPAVAK